MFVDFSFLRQLPNPIREAYQAARRILWECETLQTVALFPRAKDAERFARAYAELREMLSYDSEARCAIERADALLSQCGPVRFDGEIYRHAHHAVLQVAKRIVHEGAVDAEGIHRLDFTPTVGDVPHMLERIVVPDLEELAVALQCEAAKAAALCEPDTKTARPDADDLSSAPAIRLCVDLAKKQITVGNQTYDVGSEAALRWIKVLADHRGDWISSSDLEKYDKELLRARTDHLKKHLPEPICILIDSETGKGSRLRLP